jgi:hypothetical protein
LGSAKYRRRRKTGFRGSSAVVNHSGPSTLTGTSHVIHADRLVPTNTELPIRWYIVDTTGAGSRVSAGTTREKKKKEWGMAVARTLQSILNTFRLSSTDIALSLTSHDERRPIQMLRWGMKIPTNRSI